MQRGAGARGATYNDEASEALRHGELQFVPTPPAPIHALLETWEFSRALCDPCCGDGAMLRVFRERGHQAFGYDIRADSCPETVQLDFLRDRWPTDWPADIVTNPPFGPQGRLAELFIGKALQVTRPYRGRVAMLLASDFDSAKTRTLLFRDHPAFAGRVVLLDRIVWYDEPVTCKLCGGRGKIRETVPTVLRDSASVVDIDRTCSACKGAGKKKVGPAENHTWFVFDWNWKGPPIVKYA